MGTQLRQAPLVCLELSRTVLEETAGHCVATRRGTAAIVGLGPLFGVPGLGAIVPPSSRLPPTDYRRTMLEVPKHTLDLLHGTPEVFSDLSRQHVRVR
jgi:hypothetical protein